ncbi:MAG TPA: sigma-70 family RNA polymerase sigma factor [Alphaproteobacteria bacterium]|nr:sigma-70 family RNA polymerase sigma factor [Alphaproteobacteria bacterium]
MRPDCELLRQFARTNSEDAFAELVKRHLNLVYSAALRQVNGDAHLAKDVAQSVFTDLARKAHSISRRENLSGWLYTSAHFAAAKLVRGENRRRDREETFMRETETINETAGHDDWAKIRSALDEAMHELKESDREAILARYFENRPFAELGAKFGLNENAARMRVERALEKLRSIFARRGIVTAGALASAISVNAVQVAPANLAAALTTTSLAAAAETGTFTFIKTMIAAKLKLAVGAIAVAGAAAAFVHQQQVQNKLRAQNESLQAQMAQLQTDNENYSNRLADAGGAQKLSDDQFNELLRLRGEVGMLRQQTSQLAKLQDENQRLEEAATQLQASNDRMKFASSLADFKANETKFVNAMKQVCLADRIWAGDNNDQYVTNFDQMTNELGGLYGSPLLDNMEFVNVGIANEHYPQMINFRERSPRQSPDGTWHRVYGLADGSVQTAVSSSDNFDAYEKYDPAENGTIFLPPNQSQ